MIRIISSRRPMTPLLCLQGARKPVKFRIRQSLFSKQVAYHSLAKSPSRRTGAVRANGNRFLTGESLRATRRVGKRSLTICAGLSQLDLAAASARRVIGNGTFRKGE